MTIIPDEFHVLGRLQEVDFSKMLHFCFYTKSIAGEKIKFRVDQVTEIGSDVRIRGIAIDPETNMKCGGATYDFPKKTLTQ